MYGTVDHAPQSGQERILILGMTPLAEEVVHEIQRQRPARHRVVGALDDAPPPPERSGLCPFLGPFCRLEAVVEALRPHRIVVALSERRGRIPMHALLEICALRGIPAEEAAVFYERLTGRVAVESLTPSHIVFSWRFRPARYHQAFARVLSVAFAILGLVGLSPLLALIAVAIKLDSAGPVLFVQPRVGAHGRPFKLLKFRTMCAGVPRSEWEGDNRDRVTRVGRWLRAFRLDELPQFINVLRREMNLIGPRPHPVSNLELFTLVGRNLNEMTGSAIAYYTLRLMVPPGLTGWAQVRYRYANNLEEEIEKLKYDLYYVKHMSPRLDLRILLETVKVLLQGRVGEDVADAAAEVTAAGASQVVHGRTLTRVFHSR